jgi:methyl-accepting chemotaxis protein
MQGKRKLTIFGKLSVRTRLSLMAGFMILLLFTVGLMGLFEMSGSQQRTVGGVDTGALALEAVDTARTAQVAFKKQVQEWKDLLLRGFNREDYDRYLGNFGKQEAEVQKELNALKALMVRLDMRTESVDALLKGHAELGTKYREALKGYEADKADPHRPVDKAVRGIDRAPTDAMDLLVEQIEKKANETFTGVRSKSVSEYVFARNLMIVLAVAALVLGALLAFYTSRHITRATGQLADTVEKVAGGDYDARSQVKSGDEFEALSSAFDTMLDERVATLAKKEKDSEALNNSIIDILRAVAKTAQGDLTIQAPVREDITGALSDAINSMSTSTAKTLAGVNTVSHEVRSASQEGRNTVLQTARGMSDIRGTIQETGKRIKRLGERSQEITGIVKLIDEISERTSVLALNANMQAAMAGEAGRGFRVVADEVQRLAERSKQATDQIGKLVSTIQTETNDTIATMDRAIGEVVKGGELAEKAASQVTHLDELGGQLLDSIQAFKLPAELVNQPAVAERRAVETRRAA